jgi:hypothetical protein
MIGWQTIVVTLIVLSAAVYAARRIWERLRSFRPTAGCTETDSGCGAACAGCGTPGFLSSSTDRTFTAADSPTPVHRGLPILNQAGNRT